MDFGILTFNEPQIDSSRKIIHIDMDAFYASVEIRENPSLKGKPVIIAKHPRESNGRGVVATASYEARKFGVHSAMSAQKAYELCPKGIFIPANFELYREISRQIQEIFSKYTSLYQPISLDEAYLDVTNNRKEIPSATIIAKRIQKDIYQKTELTCSAGVSYNKFIAKLASDYRKPMGLTVIEPHQAVEFLKDLPIKAFHGVGKKSQEKLHALGIYTGEDLYQMSQYDLVQIFGKMGVSLYKRVRGIDDSTVNPTRDRKSLGKERTYQVDLQSEEEVVGELRKLSTMVYKALEKKRMHGKTIVLKIRTSDFETLTRRRTFPYYIRDKDEILNQAITIFEEEGSIQKGIRLLGITITSLDPIVYENITLPLWDHN